LHFAVALLLTAVACDVLGLAFRREALLLAGRWNTLFGAGAAALSVLTGLLAAATLEPFAPAGARRVTSLDFEGAPEVTETRAALPPFEAIAALPEGATPLEAAPHADPLAVVFGVFHTDGNMHVNSLAYLRVLEEAALRRFVELGRGSLVLGRRVDIAYRKPCFAGQTMRVVQQAFEADGKLGMSAVLVDAAAMVDGVAPADARPHIFARTMFEP